MAATHSTMELEPGTTAPHFSLPNLDGKTVCIDDFWASKALLVMFICSHCPYVRHLRAGIAALARDYEPRGLAAVAIAANGRSPVPLPQPK